MHRGGQKENNSKRIQLQYWTIARSIPQGRKGRVLSDKKERRKGFGSAAACREREKIGLTCLREEITTEAPSSARRRAMAKPIPCVDAVMTATFPSNSLFFSLPISRPHRSKRKKRKKITQKKKSKRRQ
jgi:hypothetical protein